MKAYKTKLFMQWAKKRKVKDTVLLNAANEMTDGLYDANLRIMFIKSVLHYLAKEKVGAFVPLLPIK